MLPWEIEGLGTRLRHLEVELLTLATKDNDDVSAHFTVMLHPS